MKKVIKLDSRYGLNTLNYIGNNDYKLVSEFDHIRVLYTNDKIIDAVDPPGGPILRVGSTIEGIPTYQIESIRYSTEHQGFIVHIKLIDYARDSRGKSSIKRSDLSNRAISRT